MVLILLLYNFINMRVEQQNDLIIALNIETRPLNTASELRSERFYSFLILITLIWSWAKKNQLWNLVNEAQLTYKQVRSLLGKHLQLDCSRLVFIYSLILLFLLAVFGVKSFYFNWPKVVGEDNNISYDGLLQFCNFLMGLPRLMVVLVMSLHILHHLMSAAWLQSLTEMRLRRNLQFYKFQLSILFPFQKRLNILAGYYFRMSYICLLYMTLIRFNHFLQFCLFDSNKVEHKSQGDLEDEAIWAGQGADNLPDPRGLLIRSLLMLAWHLAFWMLLLASAYIQQKEYFSLMQESWSFKTEENSAEVKAFIAENSWKGHTFNRMDMLDILVRLLKNFTKFFMGK